MSFSFDLDSLEAPHYPLPIFWNRALQEFDPLGDDDGLDKQIVDSDHGQIRGRGRSDGVGRRRRFHEINSVFPRSIRELVKSALPEDTADFGTDSGSEKYVHPGRSCQGFASGRHAGGRNPRGGERVSGGRFSKTRNIAEWSRM
jgi:hypothetical protein